MNPTRLSLAILAAANTSSVKKLADQCGLSPSTLSKLVSTDRRIDVETLCRLCTRTPADIGLKLLLAHLHDEVERSGRNEAEVSISASGRASDDDLAVLANELRRDRPNADELRALVHDLAELVRAYHRSLERVSQQQATLKFMAAEAPASETPLQEVITQETARRAHRKRHSSNSSSSSSATA